VSAISGLSMYDSLAGQATSVATSQAREQIGMAVMKQIIDQNKQQGEAIVEMIQAGSPASLASEGLGQNVDVYA
jgi:hypothetical protein